MEKYVRRKLFAVVLTLAMVMSLLPAVALPANAVSDTWNGNIDTAWHSLSTTSFTIDTAAALAGLASIVNAGTDTFSGDRITLGADLDLSDVDSYQWTPIGSNSTTCAFMGTFDGGGHTITLQTDTSAVRTAGVFGFIGSTGTVDNLTVDGSVRVSYSLVGVKAGCIAGYNEGTISNCTANGSVRGTATTSGVNEPYTCIGGIAGANIGGSIESCTSTGTVEGTTITSLAAHSNAYVGGIVGRNQLATITDCHSTGDVTGTVETVNGPAWCYVGGIAGNIPYATGSTTVSQCDSSGQIFGSATAAAGEACTYVGGVAGIVFENGATIETSSSNCTVSGEAFSSGSSDSAAFSGGFVGLLSYGAGILNCHSDGVASGFAKASGTGKSDAYIGGFAGMNYNYTDIYSNEIVGSIDSCFSTGTARSDTVQNCTVQNSCVGGFIGYNDKGGSITESFSTCSVQSELADTENTLSVAGGFAGLNNINASITNCYAVGPVSASGATVGIGGFAGKNYSMINSCYAVGSLSGSGTDMGGFVGVNYDSATISAGYFDTQTTGQTAGVGYNTNTASGAVSVTGLTTPELTGTAAADNLSLDFTLKWKTQGNTTRRWYYPQLKSVSSFSSVTLPVAITGFEDLGVSVRTQNIEELSGSASVTLPSSVGATMNGLYSVSVPVDGWSPDMIYPAQTGTYTLTPSISNYTIGGSVSLPQITVQVLPRDCFFLQRSFRHSVFLKQPVCSGKR